MTRTIVTSRKNAWFRRFRDAFEHHEDEIAIEGPKAIHDAIRLGWKPLALAATGSEPPIAHDVPLIELPPPLFGEISDTVTSQGLIALFERPRTTVEELFPSAAGMVVVLDSVQDPGNVGTIVRLAAAFDAAGVALTEGSADPFGPKAIRASAGAVLTVPISRTTRRELLAAAEARGYDLWAATAGDHQQPMLPARLAIAFGSEGQGVSGELAARAKPVSLPMSGRVESLNVASAAAILLSRLYEARGTFSAAPGSR